MKTPQTFKTLQLSKNKLEVISRMLVYSDEPQLVMRPRLVGICRSDVKELLGTRTVRHDFGHEILAEIISSNRKSTQMPNVGDLVVLDPHVEIQRSSGFGELVVALGSESNLAKAFIKVPSSADKFVFTEPLACAHHCVSNLLTLEKRKNLKGLSIGIVGAGMTGTLIGLLCKHYGATVTIINRSQERLDFLEFASVFSVDELGSIHGIEQEFDIIIPTTTFLFPEILKFCKKIVKDGGTVLLYGGTKAGDTFPGVDNVDIDDVRRKQRMIEITASGKDVKLCGTHGASTNDFKAVIGLLEKSYPDFPVERLISHRIKLNEVPETIIALTKKEMLGKTIVDFDNN